ncbi:hypothetical protein [Paludibacter sp.]|uniref:hypothetical protein n=1 Tax=Paludibacter sp. TaxID=1898105 RepID=UPI0013530424|nr:hypothetical protein [Paludibacter sp.]MTK53605.1 hypothetical protein [Paludibacter sp.]
MASYYVNRQPLSTGEHEVHRSDCEHLPNIKNLYYLGNLDSAEEAILEAEKYFVKVKGCEFCCVVETIP